VGRAAVLGVPAADLLNRSVELSAVWSVRRCAEIASVAESPTLCQRRAALSKVLIADLSAANPLDEAVVVSIFWLSSQNQGPIHELSTWLGMSNRQLQRRFLHAVGYGPKMLQSVFHFQRLLHALRRQPSGRSLADLAADLGYSDQAHMTREVQRFANCSPTTFLCPASARLWMSDLFKTRPGLPNYR